jgi:hypothetical protein
MHVAGPIIDALRRRLETIVLAHRCRRSRLFRAFLRRRPGLVIVEGPRTSGCVGGT